MRLRLRVGIALITIICCISPAVLAENRSSLQSIKPSDMLIEAIHTALQDCDAAVIGRLHEFDDSSQCGVVEIERQLKGPVSTNAMRFFYPRFSVDLRNNVSREGKPGDILHLYGVWLLKKNEFEGPEYVQSLLITLPVGLDINLIPVTAEFSDEFYDDQFEKYCGQASRSSKVVTGTVQNVKRVENEKGQVVYEIVLDQVRDMKNNDAHAKTITTNIKPNILQELLEKREFMMRAEDGNEADLSDQVNDSIQKQLTGTMCVWLFRDQGQRNTVHSVIPFENQQELEQLHKRLNQLRAAADKAYDRGDYRSARKQYRRLLKYGAVPATLKHCRKRLLHIEMLEGGCSSQSVTIFCNSR